MLLLSLLPKTLRKECLLIHLLPFLTPVCPFPLYLIVLIYIIPIPFLGFLLFKQYINLMNNIQHFLFLISIFFKVDLRNLAIALGQAARKWKQQEYQ